MQRSEAIPEMNQFLGMEEKLVKSDPLSFIG
jgi:hypothetical protein